MKLKLSRLVRTHNRSRRPAHMLHVMAGQRAGVRCPSVRDRHPGKRRHHVHIKVHKPLAADRSARRAHTVRRVARRAAHPRIDVIGVIVEARILHHLIRQIMTLPA